VQIASWAQPVAAPQVSRVQGSPSSQVAQEVQAVAPAALKESAGHGAQARSGVAAAVPASQV
jgi:hypothetical protein